ncbi:MAG: peptide ABC transporter substrate-binding protein, partial [Tissierellia bacterium]|nr:peptide ABC transporter substrate-binding protein [Tissierellia bacterium]
EDGLEYTFVLKDDIKWSNGDEITAEDFEYSWKRVLDPEKAHDYAFQLFYLKNGEEYLKGEATAEEVGVKAVDDKTLEVTLKAPVAYFKDLTAFYTLYPINSKVDQENPDWAKKADTYVSNGPFVLDQWDPNSKIILVKNDEYYEADKVKVDGIDLDVIEEASTAYEKFDAGEYDILVDPPQQVVAEKLENNDPLLEVGKMAGTYYYNLNTENPLFANAKVRNALSMALDRQIIVDKIAQGGQMPAEGVVPFGLPDPDGKEFREYNGSLVTEDKEKAKELLEEGLKEEGLTVDDLNGAVLLYNTSEGHQKIAEAVQEMWRQNLGIEIGLENVDFQVKLDREKAGDYEISRAGWIGDYADPMTMVELWQSDSAFNDANYNNPEYDRLVDEVKASNDQELRFNNMAEAEKLLMEDMPVIPVYFYTQPYLVQENVKGIYKALLEYPTLTYAEID